MDFFKPATTWSTEKVRGFLNDHSPESYNLLDVRQGKEYEGGHLPGAHLIPLGELETRYSELDPLKPTIVYCASGARSRAAAAILERRGFDQVLNMGGGIHAWEGQTADGPPIAGITCFDETRAPEECAALAWHLEENTRLLYLAMAGIPSEPEDGAIFLELAADEEHHREFLAEVYRRYSHSSSSIPAFPGQGRSLEGGMDLEEALQWIGKKQVADILELALSIEANAYDRYLKMLRKVKDESSRAIFRLIAGEERSHLKRLTSLLDKKL